MNLGSDQARDFSVPGFAGIKDVRVGVIGLGYVGLPLAVAFGKVFPTLGFDTNEGRIAELKSGRDCTDEVTAADIRGATNLRFASAESDLANCNVLIVAVPTPITPSRTPDLRPLILASEMVGRIIRKGAVVIYESTVYPGATEEDCIPVVEQISGLKYNADFYAGYSPERINPGDKERPINRIVKVTSGSTPEVADFVDSLYGAIIEVGTFKANSIRIVEASKIVENTQRDVNIALINELSIIFAQLGIDTNDVLDAASTKWNFIHMRPGLVGGHCIGVDPYYLVHKSMTVGFIPDIIRSAREINDGMARNAVVRLIKKMISRDIAVKGSRVLMVGFSFKENCPDTRNTKVIDMVADLKSYGMDVDIVDTWAEPERVLEEYGLHIASSLPQTGGYEAVVVAVPHTDIVGGGAEGLRALMKRGGVLFDMKAVFKAEDSDLRL